VSRVLGGFQPFAVGRMGLASVRQSYNVTYTVSYENRGSQSADDVTLSARMPDAALLLGPEPLWSSTGTSFSARLGTVPGQSSGSVQILVRSSVLDVGDAFSADFLISAVGALDLSPEDNAFADSFLIAEAPPGGAPVVGETPVAASTPTALPRATEVSVAPDLPAVLTSGDGVVVLVPPGAVEATMVLRYDPEPTPAPPGPGRQPGSQRVLQAFRLSFVPSDSRTNLRTAEATQLLQPLVVSIAYDNALLGGANPRGLAVVRQNADGTLVPLATVLDTGSRTVSVAIDSVGRYSLVLNQVPYRVFLPTQMRVGSLR
jgi:hypothetical protein